MSIQTVMESGAINMLGPYLATDVTCPFCCTKNEFIFIESRASPVKPVITCEHVKARIMDDDGNNLFEFSDN